MKDAFHDGEQNGSPSPQTSQQWMQKAARLADEKHYEEALLAQDLSFAREEAIRELRSRPD